VKREATTVAGLLEDATSRIAAALGLARRDARLDARVLAAFAWDVAPAWLIAHDADVPRGAGKMAFEALVERRIGGEPIAYITGQREFFGRTFRVTADVLIPRPETELLVELALARLPEHGARTVLDLGTGSGCIALTLACERPDARVTAVDRADAALAVARDNAGRLNAGVEFLNSLWFAELAGRRFDLIVGNPPYVACGDGHLRRGDVRREPHSALAAGADGLDDLRHIVAEAPRHLRPAGSLLLEHGYDQGEAVRDMLARAGFRRIRSWSDLAGIPRVSGGDLSE
jgi:release factor glutamine methyltransferase